MTIKQSIPNLLNGVSQQPKALRLSSQAEAQDNMLSSSVFGLRKRPPTKHEALMTATQTGYDTAFVHTVNRSATDRYDVIAVNGDLAVFDALSGAARTVIFPNGKAYLTSVNGFKATTVGDYTFLVNLDTVVKRSNKKAPVAVYEALLFVRQADYSTKYTVTINGIAATYTTPDLSANASRSGVDTTNIATAFKALLDSTTGIQSQFTVTQYGSTLHLTRGDGADFTLRAIDGLSDKGLKVVKGRTQTFADLPLRAKAGMVVEIIGDVDSVNDNYFVKYEDAVTAQQGGIWRECAQPGSPLGVDPTTMPWALKRMGTFLDGAKANAAPGYPVTTEGLTTSISNGWTNGTGGVTAETTDQNMTTHGEYRTVTPTGLTNVSRKLVVNFDVNAAAMDPAYPLTLTLLVDVGAGFVSQASRQYSSGVYPNQSLTVTMVLPATAVVKLSMAFSNNVTPSNGRNASVDARYSTHPTAPAVVTSVSSGERITMAAGPYPVATQVKVQFFRSGYAESFIYTVTTADETAAQVATGLCALVNASPSYDAVVNVAGSFDVVYQVGGGSPLAYEPQYASTFFPAVYNFYDPKQTMVVNEHVGRTIKNLSDGSSGTITSNGVTTIKVASLNGGINNQFNIGDSCLIVATGQYFVFDKIGWNERLAGDLTICPLPSFVDRTINEVFFYANRLGFLAQENVVMSAAGDLFRFVRASATALFDDDPIDVKSAHKDVSMFDHAVPWNDRLFLGSGSGHQFSLIGAPLLTPSTVVLDHLSSYPMSRKVRPVPLGTRLLFPRDTQTKVQMMEYWIDRFDNVIAHPITQHVQAYMAGPAFDLAGDAGVEFLALLTTGGAQDTIYVNTYHYEDDQRTMNSWSRWTFPGAKVLSIDMVDGVLRLVMKRSDGIFIETINVGEVPNGSADHRDRQGYTTPVSFTSSYTLNPLYIRDKNDAAKTSGRLQVRYLDVMYNDARDFTVTVTAQGRAAKAYVFTAAAVAVGKFHVPIQSKNDTTTIVISSAAATGFALTGVEWEGVDHNRGRTI